MSKAKLTTKLLGKAISTLGKAAPEGTVTYDLVKGFSKKGNFSIYSFRDAAGRLLGRESNYLNGIDDLVEYRNYQYLRNSRYTETVSVLNSTTPKTNRSLIIFDSTKSNKDAWKFDIKPFDEYSDSHIISYLSPGKKAKNVSFSTYYTGHAPFDLATSNTKRVLTERNREYLPLVTSEYMPNIRDKVMHIKSLQEKKFGLKNILPPIKRVPHKSLQNGDDVITANIIARGQCEIRTGQIEFSDELAASSDLLDVLAHEYKHASDASKVFRLENNVDEFLSLTKEQKLEMIKENKVFAEAFEFAEKSIGKGVIKKDSKSGEIAKKLEQSFENEAGIAYWDRLHEVRARRASAEQLQRYNSCWNSLRKLFQAQFIPKEI